MNNLKFALNLFLSLSFLSSVAFAEIIDLSGKTPQEYSEIITAQRGILQKSLGKQCAITTQAEFELTQNQVTDPDLKISDQEFSDYINKNGIGYSSDFATAPSESANTCFMTKKEYYALRSYTGSFYSVLNRALRDKIKVDLEKYRIIIKYVQAALTKLKPFEGYVKRGTSMPANLLALHTPPNEVTYNAFTSTSVAGGFGGTINYVIQSHTCRYIAPFSMYVNEEEVLCGPGSTFKIYHREEVSGVTRILMDEVPSEFNIDEFLKTLN